MTDTHSKKETHDVHRRTWLAPAEVYKIIQREGEEELSRRFGALWWSGIAAGMTIGMSIFAEAVIRNSLPDTGWRPLVESLGYCTGFLIVILSRHQLFTENTITPILPLMARRTRKVLISVARLWAIVAAANLAGAFLFAVFWTYSGVVDQDVLSTMLDIARETMDKSWLQMLTKAVGAGFLMASIVWILPTARGAEFWSVFIILYLMAAGDLTHLVSSGIQILLLTLAGEVSFASFVWDFGLPVFIGNVVGGTGLFSLIVYAQVHEEIGTSDPKK